MTRIAALSREDIAASSDESIAGLLDVVEAVMGFVPNSMLTMAHRPEILKTFAAMAGTINAPGEVSIELKRMIAEIASGAAGCQYCVAHTSHQAHRSGIEDAKLTDVWNFERSELFSAAEKAALLVAMKGAQVPCGIEDADMAALKEHFDDGQIVEIVGVISLFGFLNRWNAIMGTTLEDEPRTFASETLAKDVWQIGAHV